MWGINYRDDGVIPGLNGHFAGRLYPGTEVLRHKRLRAIKDFRKQLLLILLFAGGPEFKRSDAGLFLESLSEICRIGKIQLVADLRHIEVGVLQEGSCLGHDPLCDK
jgi:hypothetical protein